MNVKSILLLFFVFIIGCDSVKQTGTAVTQTDIPPTSTQTFGITDICLEEKEVDLENLELNGNILVYQDKVYKIFDTDEKSFIDISESAHVSPDGEKIAQYDDEKKGIKITTLTGSLITFFPQNNQWLEANSVLYDNTNTIQFGWWDDNFLYIRSLPVGSQLMLSIDTGEVQEIEFPYSNEVWAFGGAIDIRDNYVSFSPDFDKVVYASTGNHLVLRNNSIYSDGTWRTVVWTGYLPIYSNPNWSPDGSKLIYVSKGKENGEDLYGIDTNAPLGERKLTDLNTLFNNPHQIWINQFDWSPNGEKIALTVRVTPNEGDESLSRLLVLEVKTGNIDDYCNPEPENPYSTNSFSFTWSPDGKYIATNDTIVDLASRIAYKFPDLYIVDWVGKGKSH